MIQSELEMLLHEKEVPCISIIIPTDRTQKKTNIQAVKKAVAKAKSFLDNTSYSLDVKNSLIIKLNEVERHIPAYSLNGIGIFISQSKLKIYVLPFRVKEKVIVGNTFETRDIFYLQQYVTPYYVLSLSKKVVRLYSASMDDLTEVKDERFPIIYRDDYEYAHASSASGSQSLKGFEKDKKQISAIRLSTVLKDADAKLSHYLKEDTGLVIAGTPKVLAAFVEVSKHTKNLLGKVAGSFNENKIPALAKAAWFEVVSHKNLEDERLIDRIRELNDGHVAEGVQQAWKAAQEGKGLLLAVEKDYHCQGYQKPDQQKLLLDPPAKPYRIINDAVDDLIETVNKKNGKILFTDNDTLAQSGHVALILRY